MPTSPNKSIVKVIIPALNEAESIAHVLSAIPTGYVNECIVVDNGSQDDTALRAKAKGATVLKEPIAGYGRACLCALRYIEQKPPLPDVVVFLDADFSDDPTEMPQIIQPILDDKADLVIGSRLIGHAQSGALTFAQRWGNQLAVRLLALLYKGTFTDLGPFRAIRYSALIQLNMTDLNYGWTIEMQIKALQHKLRYTEYPVHYRRRKYGQSKISGNLKSACKAAYVILYSFVKYRPKS